MKSLLLILLLMAPLHAQRLGKIPAASDIMAKVSQPFDGVNDFVVTVEATIDMERIRIPQSTATMYFKKPDKVHFNSSSFAIIPRDGIALNPSMLRDRYDASFLGEEKLEGKKTYKLQLTAKESRTRLRVMDIWVDPGTWTITKLDAVPYEGRTLAISFTYSLQQGKYWLPSRLTATFGLASGDTERTPGVPLRDLKPELGEFQRSAPRTGTITITYTNYKINVNLPDEIFETQLDR